MTFGPHTSFGAHTSAYMSAHTSLGAQSSPNTSFGAHTSAQMGDFTQSGE